MTYIDKSSQLDRNWLLSAARGAARPVVAGEGLYRLAPARLAWAYVDEPRRYDPEPPATEATFKYEAGLIFPWELSITEAFGPAELAAIEAGKVKFGASFETNSKLKKPWKNQADQTNSKTGELPAGYNPTGFCATPMGSAYPFQTFDLAGNPVEGAERKRLFRSGNWVVPVVKVLAYANKASGVNIAIQQLIFLAEDKIVCAGGGPRELPTEALSGLGSLAPPPIAAPSFD